LLSEELDALFFAESAAVPLDEDITEFETVAVSFLADEHPVKSDTINKKSNKRLETFFIQPLHLIFYIIFTRTHN
jgi:hypothetical protein